MTRTLVTPPGLHAREISVYDRMCWPEAELERALAGGAHRRELAAYLLAQDLGERVDAAIDGVDRGRCEKIAAAVPAAASPAVWAEAEWRLPATSSMAARQTLVRSMGIPLGSYFFD